MLYSELMSIREDNGHLKQGQVVIVLLLIIVVALAIGLSISSRSISEIATSAKTERSSRAFSAAEAGIEKALIGDISVLQSGITFPENQSAATVSDSGLIPLATQALEYPPIDKNNVAHFWLANPQDLTAYYTVSNFELFFGRANQSTSSEDAPAVEVNVITLNAGVYQSNRYYFDSNSSRVSRNNFRTCSAPTTRPTGTSTTFLCRSLVPEAGGYAGTPILARVRLLYSSSAQPVAINPLATQSLPPQARVFTSTGTSGNVQRRLQLFTQTNVINPILDYVLFSAGDISK